MAAIRKMANNDTTITNALRERPLGDLTARRLIMLAAGVPPGFFTWSYFRNQEASP
jgi:hypothetical protein